MNKSLFTGRITRDPELRHTTDGAAVCTIDIAVDDGYKEKKRTFYPTIVLWRNNAEYIGKYAHKGDLIEVSARYTERKWEDKEGRKRTSVEFVADDVKILSSKHHDHGEDVAQQATSQGFSAGDFRELDDDELSGDLPF